MLVSDEYTPRMILQPFRWQICCACHILLICTALLEVGLQDLYSSTCVEGVLLGLIGISCNHQTCNHLSCCKLDKVHCCAENQHAGGLCSAVSAHSARAVGSQTPGQ